MGNEEDKTKGLLWRLPLVQSRDVGKIGPAFGYGIGCGVGFGIGLLGGAGLGVGVPGVQFGVGVGAGCGVGLGFGYGVGRGWAHDENGKYTNVGRLFRRRNASNGGQIAAMLDDLISSTKRVFDAIDKEIDKRR